MTTPDPTAPALLSAARLDEIRDGFEASEAYYRRLHTLSDEAIRDLFVDARSLLAHLDALTAPAPADGGEALGRMLHQKLEIDTHCTSFAWSDLSEENQERHTSAALALDAHGYARGVAAGEAALADARAIEVNLRDSCRIFGINIEERDAEIARLTAELAAAHDRALAHGVAVVASTERAMQAQIDALAAELAEARGSAKRWASLAERNGEDAIAHAARAADARRDGAREEREAIRDKVDHDARFGADSARAPMLAIVDWLDSRARGEGQGS